MAPQMAQGRHFPGDPPADQFPNSVSDGMHCSHFLNDLILNPSLESSVILNYISIDYIWFGQYLYIYISMWPR